MINQTHKVSLGLLVPYSLVLPCKLASSYLFLVEKAQARQALDEMLRNCFLLLASIRANAPQLGMVGHISHLHDSCLFDLHSEFALFVIGLEVINLVAHFTVALR